MLLVDQPHQRAALKAVASFLDVGDPNGKRDGGLAREADLGAEVALAVSGVQLRRRGEAQYRALS